MQSSESSTNDEVEPVEPTTRKRGERNDDKYARNIIKKARIKSTAYKNYKGKDVKEKKVGDACRCHMRCFTKTTESDRLEVFNKLYNLNTKDEQDIYLQGLLEIHSIRRKSNTSIELPPESKKQRSCSFYHYVVVNGIRRKICQNAFLSMHGIGIKRLKRIKVLLQQNQTPHDKRGTNPKANAIPEADNILIRQHIDSFPVKVIHYSNKTYQYLDAKLNLKIMYSLFKTKHSNSNIRYSYYVKYFHSHFNLHFGRPQVDTCCTCEELNVKKSASLCESAKRTAVAELLVHKRRSKKFYASLKKTTEECQNRDDLMGLTFDYMQNVHLPEIPVQDLFYLTQLTVNVFGIHNCKTGKSLFYVYHEGIANKGPDEVCSFIWDYIQKEIPESIQELRLYSDNCSGQNKNHPMIRMCMALVETGKFRKVEQFYPIRGHSFLPNDRDFGLVKKNLKKHDRIFSVHKYTELIVSSSARKNFAVKEVETKEILSFKSWWPKFYKKTAISLETMKKQVPRDKKQVFSISHFHYFLHDSSKPGYVTASQFIESFSNHTFHIHMPKSQERIPVNMPQSKAYPDNNVPILETKIQDLRKMMRFIDNEYLTFYQTILEWPTKMSRNRRQPAECHKEYE